MKATVPVKLDLGRLAAEHYVAVWRYLRLLGCDAALAEDLCQDTFLRVLEKPFDDLSAKATSAYLRRVAKSRFIDEVRRQQKTVPGDLDQADLVWDEYEGDDAGETWVEALRTCLNLLGGRARAAIDKQYREKLPIDAIAESLGMQPSGVKTLLGRSKAKLRACVERRVATE